MSLRSVALLLSRLEFTLPALDDEHTSGGNLMCHTCISRNHANAVWRLHNGRFDLFYPPEGNTYRSEW